MEIVATAIAHKCSTCRRLLFSGAIRFKFGQRYCSIMCEDIGEEKNQGNETVHFEMEET